MLIIGLNNSRGLQAPASFPKSSVPHLGIYFQYTRRDYDNFSKFSKKIQ